MVCLCRRNAQPSHTERVLVSEGRIEQQKPKDGCHHTVTTCQSYQQQPSHNQERIEESKEKRRYEGCTSGDEAGTKQRIKQI